MTLTIARQIVGYHLPLAFSSNRPTHFSFRHKWTLAHGELLIYISVCVSYETFYDVIRYIWHCYLALIVVTVVYVAKRPIISLSSCVFICGHINSQSSFINDSPPST